jgi:nucleotide-binding universal stress UspA family protein
VFRRILFPTDGSPASVGAADSAVEFARSAGASLIALHVAPELHLFTYEPEVTEAEQEQYRRTRDARAHNFLAYVQQRAARAGVACESLVAIADEPYEAIISTARERQCDVIAMASHGRKGLRALLLGSQTQKVLTHSAIPVLVLR